MTRRTPRLRRAFTLIELLIVVAIIAIISGALMGGLILPLKEHPRADADAAMQRGAALFAAAVTADAHDALSAEVSANGSALLIRRLPEGSPAALYWTDEGSSLRRALVNDAAASQDLEAAMAATETGAALLADVSAFRATVTTQTLSIELTAGHVFYEVPVRAVRSFELTLGPAGWAGGTP
ncbi:MAG: prepilin-type N-terminal cleavage/methylation domain-containing protein [Sumerlaeia bacterium]